MSPSATWPPRLVGCLKVSGCPLLETQRELGKSSAKLGYAEDRGSLCAWEWLQAHFHLPSKPTLWTNRITGSWGCDTHVIGKKTGRHGSVAQDNTGQVLSRSLDLGKLQGGSGHPEV